MNDDGSTIIRIRICEVCCRYCVDSFNKYRLPFYARGGTNLRVAEIRTALAAFQVHVPVYRFGHSLSFVTSKTAVELITRTRRSLFNDVCKT